MHKGFFWKTVGFIALLAIPAYFLTKAPFFSKQTISYEKEVKPILNKHCLKCHGGVKRSGGFSLITRMEAIAPAESGLAPIVPGHPETSEMIRRITTSDPDDRMPQDAPPLSGEEIAVLKKWIAQGAAWELHWSFKPVAEVEVPKTERLLSSFGKSKTWAKNEIDHFVLAKQQEHGLKPSPQAPNHILLRRASLDLIGLPAPAHLAERFLQNEMPYETLLDSLLASAAFGERWASVWLDIARYSDSKGYEKDNGRNVWRYRDWVIRALNDGMPYDEFIQLQMAGDLLPHPTDDQYLATTFHRLTSTNDEGGTDNEEFRVAAVIDRVATTWEGIMGTTFACAQCHGHPYDPITHQEYYQFMAFLNNQRDEDTPAEYPVLRHLSAAETERLKGLTTWVSENVSPEKAQAIYTFVRTLQPSHNSLKADSMVNADLYGVAHLGLRPNGSARLKNIDLTGKSTLIYWHFIRHSGGQWTIHLDSPDGPPLLAKKAVSTDNKWQMGQVDFRETAGVHDLYFRYDNPKADPTQPGILFDWLHFGEAFPGQDKPHFAAQKNTFWELLNAEAEATPILFENPADMYRPTHVFDRGSFLTPLEEVQPAVPAIFTQIKTGTLDRLALAQWMTDKNNPLTARTLVNRLWAELFGQGIAMTVEDLGSQGSPPSHPELMDWLAYRLMHHHQWQVKPLLKEMMLSATYQQASNASEVLLKNDPYNEYYTRGPRVRLSAEQIRDNALAASGLLSSKMFGPPVMPYQPDGIWQTPYSGEQWELSEGEDRYRRSIYTFWKRSAPYPSAMIFDAAAKDVCSARRVRTNTPLQALVTLNDPVFFEAACHLAVLMKKENGEVEDQIKAGYERVTGMPVSQEKLSVFQNLYETSLEAFRSGGSDATGFLQMLEEVDDEETAALAVVGNALLNLDEFVVKN